MRKENAARNDTRIDRLEVLDRVIRAYGLDSQEAGVLTYSILSFEELNGEKPTIAGIARYFREDRKRMRRTLMELESKGIMTHSDKGNETVWDWTPPIRKVFGLVGGGAKWVGRNGLLESDLMEIGKLREMAKDNNSLSRPPQTVLPARRPIAKPVEEKE